MSGCNCSRGQVYLLLHARTRGSPHIAPALEGPPFHKQPPASCCYIPLVSVRKREPRGKSHRKTGHRKGMHRLRQKVAGSFGVGTYLFPLPRSATIEWNSRKTGRKFKYANQALFGMTGLMGIRY